jgi:deoxyribodipyrimidine photolyase
MQHAMHFGRRRLIWHRHRDLRLHDNPFYHVNDDAKNPVQCIPVFIFDESEFTPRPSTCRPQHWNAVNVGPHAARILLESVHDLRRSLRQRGGELHIRQGSTLPILLQLIQETQATEVVWNQEPGLYEQEQSQKVQRAIASRFPKVTMHLCADATLYHPDDLPRTTDEWEQCAHPKKQPSKRKQNQNGGKKTYESFSHSRRHHVEEISTSRFEGIPPVMGDFRRAARVKAQIRPCLDTPSSACQWETTSLDAGDIPTLEDLIQPILTSAEKPILGMPQSLIEQICRHAMEQYNNNNQENPNVVVRGGETRALHHLQDFCQHYAATAQRNLACVDHHQGHGKYLASFLILLL